MAHLFKVSGKLYGENMGKIIAGQVGKLVCFGWGLRFWAVPAGIAGTFEPTQAEISILTFLFINSFCFQPRGSLSQQSLTVLFERLDWLSLLLPLAELKNTVLTN